MEGGQGATLSIHAPEYSEVPLHGGPVLPADQQRVMIHESDRIPTAA
jgi:hypothetical protein